MEGKIYILCKTKTWAHAALTGCNFLQVVTCFNRTLQLPQLQLSLFLLTVVNCCAKNSSGTTGFGKLLTLNTTVPLILRTGVFFPPT